MSKPLVIGVVTVIVGVITVGGFLLWQNGLRPFSPTSEQSVRQTPSPDGTSLPDAISGRETLYEKVLLEPDLVLKESFEGYPISRGLLQTETELKTIWAFTENWRTRSYVQSPPIDFTEYSVIWYATKSDASFVEIEKMEEFSEFVEVKVVIVHSDFLTRELFLWMIPKTTKEIRFVERTEFNPI